MPRPVSVLKWGANRLLRPIGFEIRRIPPPPPVPVLVDGPEQAMSMIRQGETATVRAPIRQCVIFNGLSLGPSGWHPFVAAAREMLNGESKAFEGSCLERFYTRWQPANALEALIGASLGPQSLAAYPRYLMHAPWLGTSPDERLRSITRIIEIENAEYGSGALGVDAGYGLQGPVLPEKGRIEYQRLARVLNSIRQHGYDRSKGDITAQILKRGETYRFRIVHGHHRAAALAALGHEHLPIQPKMLLDRTESAHWPQVYRGAWSQAQAETFFDHHFDFDSRAWAARLSLT